MNQMKASHKPAKQNHKRSVLLVSLVLLLVMMLGATSGVAAQSGRATISPNVLEALKTKGSVKVIINLAAAGNIGNAAAFISEIASAQNSVLAAFPAGSFSLTAQFKTIPALSGTITRDGLLALRNHPLVTIVNLDKQVFLAETLNAQPRYDDEAKLLHRADLLNAAGYTGVGSRIGIIDTGIDNQHPSTALLESLFHQHCFRTEADCTGGDTSAEDEHSHGTHVAGIITGANGVAPDAQFAALKVFTTGSTSDTNILNALDYAAVNDATLDLDGVSMSLGNGFPYPDQAACDADNAGYVSAFATLNGLGIAVFVATGNEYFTDGVAGPGCVTGAIGVGSVDDAVGVWDERSAPDVVTSFSNATPVQGAGELVDVLAPGCAILSEVPPDLNGGATTDNYCGTSMATPTVSGIFAALLEFQALTPAEAENLLESSGDLVVDDRAGMNNLQFPRIDAMNAYGALSLEVPTGLTAATVSATQVDLDWTDVTGETGYVVERSADDGSSWAQIGTTGADVVAFSDNAPVCGLLTYRVRSTDGAANSLPSNEATATAYACPLAPTGLSVAPSGATNLNLTWTDNATDETAYSVERDLGEGFVEIATPAADSTSYLDTTALCGYNAYRVAAYRASDTSYSDYSNTVVVNNCAPANDEYANAETLSGADVEGNFLYATIADYDPTFTCRFGGEDFSGHGIWYTFTPITSGTFSIDTIGSVPVNPTANPDSIIGVYTGGPGEFTEVACNDDLSLDDYLSQLVDVPVTAGVTYYITVNQWSTSPTSFNNIDELHVNFSTTATLAEKVVNGSFETDANSDKQPDNWTANNPLGDKMKCNDAVKTVSHGGNCAYMFKGGVGLIGALVQKPSAAGLVSGDTVHFSLWAQTKLAAAGTLGVVKITYADGTKEKLQITLSSAAVTYAEFTDEAVLAQDATKIKIVVSLKLTAGKVYVDDVSLEQIPGAPAKVDSGIIPLPESNVGSRGGGSTKTDSSLGGSRSK